MDSGAAFLNLWSASTAFHLKDRIISHRVPGSQFQWWSATKTHNLLVVLECARVDNRCSSAFHASAPREWNRQLLSLRNPNSLPSFIKRLKNSLFLFGFQGLGQLSASSPDSCLHLSFHFSCDLRFPFPCDLRFPFPYDLRFHFPSDLRFHFKCDLRFPFPCDLRLPRPQQNHHREEGKTRQRLRTKQ